MEGFLTLDESSVIYSVSPGSSCLLLRSRKNSINPAAIAAPINPPIRDQGTDATPASGVGVGVGVGVTSGVGVGVAVTSGAGVGVGVGVTTGVGVGLDVGGTWRRRRRRSRYVPTTTRSTTSPATLCRRRRRRCHRYFAEVGRNRLVPIHGHSGGMKWIPVLHRRVQFTNCQPSAAVALILTTASGA